MLQTREETLDWGGEGGGGGGGAEDGAGLMVPLFTHLLLAS